MSLVVYPPEKNITIGDAVVHWTPDGALTTYGDGSSYGARARHRALHGNH